MKINRDQVKHISLLARIGIDESEIEKLQHQLSDILDNFEILKQVDTTDLEPTAQIISISNVFRTDDSGPSYPNKEILANAPQIFENYFKVRAVLE